LDDDVSREYYSQVMKILDVVLVKTKSYDEVDGVIKVSGKIPKNPSGISESTKSMFNKRFFQTLDLNFVFTEGYRYIELLDKDIGVFFVLDEKNKICKKVKKGKLLDGIWHKRETDEIPLKDALVLAKLGEDF
jgi:hypothetical protein